MAKRDGAVVLTGVSSSVTGAEEDASPSSTAASGGGPPVEGPLAGSTAASGGGPPAEGPLAGAGGSLSGSVLRIAAAGGGPSSAIVKDAGKTGCTGRSSATLNCSSPSPRQTTATR